jgi:apolipoprotein N-acyltransferase
MRAIEFDRPILRATNTGATVVIDHKGVVTQSLARSTRGMLNAHLSGEMLSRTSLTPYALWAFQYGLKPLWIVACGLITLAFLRRKSRFPPSRE